MKSPHTNRYETPTKTLSALDLLQEGPQDFFLQLAFHTGSRILHSTRKVCMHRKKLLFHIEISIQVPPLLNPNIDYVIHQNGTSAQTSFISNNKVLESTLVHRDVTAGATDATAVATKFSVTLTLFQPGGGWGQILPQRRRVCTQNSPGHGYIV